MRYRSGRNRRQRRIYRAESGLYTIYRQCPEGVGGVATALARDGRDTEAFTRLLRMDGAIERSIATTIRLLGKLQKERGGGNIVKSATSPPPAPPPLPTSQEPG